LRAGFDRDSKPFKETAEAYERAKENVSLARAGNFAADKQLVLDYISATQGSRISDADYRIQVEQGSIPVKISSIYEQAATGRLDDSVRDNLLETIKGQTKAREVRQRIIEGVYRDRSVADNLDPDKDQIVVNYRPTTWKQEFEGLVETDSDALTLINKLNSGLKLTPEEIKGLSDYRERRKAGGNR